MSAVCRRKNILQTNSSFITSVSAPLPLFSPLTFPVLLREKSSCSFCLVSHSIVSILDRNTAAQLICNFFSPLRQMCGEEARPAKMLNVKCQNVSEKYAKPTQEPISSTVGSVSYRNKLIHTNLVYLQTRFPSVVLANVCSCYVNSTKAEFDGCLCITLHTCRR